MLTLILVLIAIILLPFAGLALIVILNAIGIQRVINIGVFLLMAAVTVPLMMFEPTKIIFFIITVFIFIFGLITKKGPKAPVTAPPVPNADGQY